MGGRRARCVLSRLAWIDGQSNHGAPAAAMALLKAFLIATRLIFLSSFLIVCWARGSLEASAVGEWSAQERPASYRELRYRGVVPQSSWITCGPAVLATYFTHYLGVETTEAEMIELLLQSRGMEARAWSVPVFFNVSMLDLREALHALGVPAAGYRVLVEDLVAYFERGGPPLILHVTRPQDHFLLAVGAVPVAQGGNARKLVVADPSYGRRLLSASELVRDFGFLGYVLVPVPPDPFFAQVKERQEAELAKELSWLRRLEAAGRWGP